MRCRHLLVPLVSALVHKEQYFPGAHGVNFVSKRNGQQNSIRKRCIFDVRADVMVAGEKASTQH